ncbi:hypothetical protein lerEdw1_013133 [Lerista edwardsae]|nr:hypothetical protein lerEdw1_013133 [Lerista edwardsae]
MNPYALSNATLALPPCVWKESSMVDKDRSLLEFVLITALQRFVLHSHCTEVKMDAALASSCRLGSHRRKMAKRQELKIKGADELNVLL